MAEQEILPGEEAVVEAAGIIEANVPQEPQGKEPVAVDVDVDVDIKEQPSSLSSPASDEGDNPDPEAFVNNGLKKWEAAREVWCGISTTTAREETSGSSSSLSSSVTYKKAVPLDVDGVIDVLFDPRWRGGGGARVKASPVPPRFPANVPLPQMIDVLTDLWEAEGLDV